MASTSDFLIIGGGIAGLSAASRLVRHGKVVVLEAEEALGYHSSGRSVSFSHYGIGNSAVRGLTAWSRPFFEDPPGGFSPTPLARTVPSLYFAAEETLPALAALEAEMTRFTDRTRRIDAAAMAALCPALRTGDGAAVTGVLDPTGLKLEADALLQACARTVRAGGGEVLNGRRITSIERQGEGWNVRAESGEQWSTPVLVNSAGAWADRLAGLAGVDPIGLEPKRRTIIVVDPPAGTDISAWPFAHSAAGDFYMLPEAGQILASPVDEVADDPCDAAPDEYDVALAADRLEHYTTVRVTRLAHRWAGLRSFVADRIPTAGFDPAAPGFFWLVGQGGYGLQTAPAMAAAVEALVTGGPWPEGLAELGVLPEHVGPERLRSSSRPAAT
jgi:D-arginine dehydrogenase